MGRPRNLASLATMEVRSTSTIARFLSPLPSCHPSPSSHHQRALSVFHSFSLNPVLVFGHCLLTLSLGPLSHGGQGNMARQE